MPITTPEIHVCKDLELIRFLFVLEAKVLIVAHLHQHVCSEWGPTQCNNNYGVVGATQKQAGFISSSSCRPHHQIRERLRAVHSSLDPLLLGINSESVGGMSKVKEIQVAVVMRITSKSQVLLLYEVMNLYKIYMLVVGFFTPPPPTSFSFIQPQWVSILCQFHNHIQVFPILIKI